MKISTRCLPYGDLPYENIKSATYMMAKLFPQFPYLAVLPKISQEDSITYRTLSNMPGVIIKDNKVSLKAGTEHYKKEMTKLDKAFNSPTMENLQNYAFDADFLDKYLNIIKKFKSKNACINILGPFTVSQILMNAAKEQMLADKSFRKLFIQSVCVKALWLVKKIKEYCEMTVPVVILEEPLLGQVGVIKKENEDITTEIITNMLAKVVDKLHEFGVIVGVQCFDKCDWNIPINANIDLVSFDAYNNPNNLNIMSEQIQTFIQQGGMINWGVVPVISEEHVKDLTADYLSKRLTATIDGLFLSGVPMDLIYKSALVSLNGNISELPAMFAERVAMLATQLSGRISVRG